MKLHLHRYLVIGMLFFFQGSILTAQGNSAAAKLTDPIKALHVGDKVPEFLIENIMNYGKEKVLFSDVKKRLILFDFWGTTCGSCIAFLPILDSLQKEFKTDLQVFTVTNFDTREKVLNTFERLKRKKNVSLPVVMNDVKLKKYFPHDLVSHVVWVKDGAVLAITGTEYVTAANVKKAFSESEVDWPVKNDVIGFDYDKPLLNFGANVSIPPKPLFYSAFLGSIPGIDSRVGTFVDSVNRTVTYTFYNNSLLQYCIGAVDGTGIGYPDGRSVVYAVKRKDRYMFEKNGNNNYYDKWASNNTYCYSIAIPFNKLSAAEINKDYPGSFSRADLNSQWTKEFIRKDLSRWLDRLGITIKKETRQVECLSLIAGKKAKELLKSKGGEMENTLIEDSGFKRLRNSNFSNLVWFLKNNVEGIPFVFDDTNLPIDFMIDIDLNSQDDIKVIRADLDKYDLNLVPIKKEMEIYIITEEEYKEGK